VNTNNALQDIIRGVPKRSFGTPAIMSDQTQTILKNVFGYETFRPLQQEIIANILSRKDTLVIMPTGGGKSLCYQIPALIFDGLTVVVSPLISLMKDQVEQLTALGIGATVLNSSLSPEEYRQNVARIMRNEVKLLYLAPETLLMQKTLAMLASRQIDCLTIDEAHCISEWGHDFRPEYRQLVPVRQRFPSAVCAAFTATATPRVQQDIKANLKFETSNAFIASFNRKNLFLQIAPKTRPLEQTVDFLEHFPNQSGIIYCLTRKQVDELAEILANEGFSVKPYHAGLSDEERKHHQELFIRDDVQIMVATIAFGMGINKPNLRFILHYDLPKNIEGYYQQIGRAGRDGLPAHCLLLFSYGDIQKVKYFIDQKEEPERRIATIHLNALVGFAETDVCRRIPLLHYFGEQHTDATCGMCDNCLEEKQELSDLTIPAQKFLSCVKRTGEMFGAGHIIDVLRGSQGQKVLKFGHQKLSTYGIGKEYSQKQWFHLSRQFLQKGLMTQDLEHGSLKLTPKAWDVFKGTERFFGKIEEERMTYEQGAEGEENYDHILFELLRKTRKELADRANVPPYVIFPDKTLIELATFFPQSEQSFLTMHGVGAAKCEKYGATFLAILREYCQTNQIAEKPKRIWKTEGINAKSTKKRKHLIIGEAFNTGKPVQDLMAEFQIQQSTILNHLFTYLQEGYPLRVGDVHTLSTLPAAQQTAVLEAFARLGTERLKPVFEAFNGEIGYEELSILRLHYVMEHQEGGKTGD
jgi:ATP-dependent DNA helicase RecQ